MAMMMQAYKTKAHNFMIAALHKKMNDRNSKWLQCTPAHICDPYSQNPRAYGDGIDFDMISFAFDAPPSLVGSLNSDIYVNGFVRLDSLEFNCAFKTLHDSPFQ